MHNERVIGISQGVIKEYKPAASLGGDGDFPIAIIKTLSPDGNASESWIPDIQDFAPETPVILTRIETTVGKGSRINTIITPLEQD